MFDKVIQELFALRAELFRIRADLASGSRAYWTHEQPSNWVNDNRDKQIRRTNITLLKKTVEVTRDTNPIRMEIEPEKVLLVELNQAVCDAWSWSGSMSKKEEYSMSEREKDLKWADEYCRKYYGKPLAERDHMARMVRYAPDIMTSWLRFRSTTWKSTEEGGVIPVKFKELIGVAVETATMKEHVGHVEEALKAGATVEEIAEVLGICIMLAGFETYMTGGRDALKRAEEYAKKMEK